jgi:hypothetical protein
VERVGAAAQYVDFYLLVAQVLVQPTDAPSAASVTS